MNGSANTDNEECIYCTYHSTSTQWLNSVGCGDDDSDDSGYKTVPIWR